VARLRRKIPRDNPLHTHDPVNLAGIVSLAGVSDLKRAWALRLSDTVVANVLGGSPDEVPDRYRVASQSSNFRSAFHKNY